MKNTFKSALIALILANSSIAFAADCDTVSREAAIEMAAKPKSVLIIVAQKIAANEACACEIVKAAIVVTEADKKLVAQIVEQAIEVAPNKLTLITNCALAVAPDARDQVMSVISKYVNVANVSPQVSSAGLEPLDFIGLDRTGNFSPFQIFLPQAGGQTVPSNPYSQP